MVKVRGLVILNSVAYVKDRFGPEGHERVLEALPAERRMIFLREIRDATWEPLDDLISYTEVAHELLAPKDPQFHWKMGSHSGRQARLRGGFQPMVEDPETAMRLGPVLWRSFVDTGRFEFIVKGKKEGVIRIHGFPSTPALCQRMCGSWEELLGSAKHPATIEKTACIQDGSPFCEMHVKWR
jgi:hypothetical protein